MKFLHVMTAYTIKPQNIMSFIDKNFNKNEHTFLILADEKYVLKNNPQLFAFDNILFVPQIDKTKKSRFLRAKYLYKVFSKAENIVWHSFLGLKGIQLLYVTYIFRKKITWIEHGHDLYYWKWNPKNIKDKIAFYFNRKIREECKNYGTTLWWDWYLIRRDFNQEGKKDVYFLPTPYNTIAVDYLKEYISKSSKKSNKNITSILVGIDGLKVNKHYDILNRLKQYKTDNYACFMPMNFSLPYEYGLINSRKYNAEVIEYGNRVLDHPVIELNKSSVELNTYFNVLNSVDVAIFDFERPIYLDMLFYLLYLGKKIYLSKESPTYKSLTKMGIVLYDINEVGKLPFCKVAKVDNLESNRTIVGNIFEDGYLKYYWKYYFK